MKLFQQQIFLIKANNFNVVKWIQWHNDGTNDTKLQTTIADYGNEKPTIDQIPNYNKNM